MLVCFIPIFFSQCKLENLEIPTSYLELTFSSIVVFETWAPKLKSEVKPKKLQGYQNYHWRRGTSMKSGGIQFKLRRDLHSGFYDADNNLQSARTDGNKANIMVTKQT